MRIILLIVAAIAVLYFHAWTLSQERKPGTEPAAAVYSQCSPSDAEDLPC